MKHFPSKWTVSLSAFALFLCLLAGSGFASEKISKIKINQSVTDKEITLTVNNYAISSNRQLVIYYTVKDKGAHDIGQEATTILKNPNLTIGDHSVDGSVQRYEQVDPNKFKGTLEVALPQYRSHPTPIKLTTDGILDQEGHWTLSFKIK